MGITWEGILIGAVVLVVGSFIAGFIDVALEPRQARRKQAEREKYWKGGE